MASLWIDVTPCGSYTHLLFSSKSEVVAYPSIRAAYSSALPSRRMHMNLCGSSIGQESLLDGIWACQLGCVLENLQLLASSRYIAVRVSDLARSACSTFARDWLKYPSLLDQKGARLLCARILPGPGSGPGHGVGYGSFIVFQYKQSC